CALMDIPQVTALSQLDVGQIICISGIPEFRLTLSIRGQPEAESRQWFPDPITLALMSRGAPDLRELRPFLSKRDAKLHCIQAALAVGGVGRQSQPASLSRLFELLRIQRQTQLPQLLINYTTRYGYVTHSVLTDSWLHLHGEPPSNHEEK